MDLTKMSQKEFDAYKTRVNKIKRCPSCGHVFANYRVIECPDCGLTTHGYRDCLGCRNFIKRQRECSVFHNRLNPIMREDGTCQGRVVNAQK